MHLGLSVDLPKANMLLKSQSGMKTVVIKGLSCEGEHPVNIHAKFEDWAVDVPVVFEDSRMTAEEVLNIFKVAGKRGIGHSGIGPSGRYFGRFSATL